MLRSVGLGLITGAADDDPSAIGTYAAAGAAFGPSFLWTAPATLPMMFVVVYLSAKLGQVSGRGLFEVLAARYPRWLLNAALVGVLIGNTIEAAADISGMAAALTIFIRLPQGMVAANYWGYNSYGFFAPERRFAASRTPGCTAVALGLNFIGVNPMKMLVFSGVVQGFSTPPLLLLIMLATNDRRLMGRWVNGRGINVLGWATTALVFIATAALVATWFM